MEAVVLDQADEAWIRQCQRGRREAFEPLVRRYGPWAFRFAVGMVKDEDAARDLSQEAFLKAYRAIGRFDVSRPFYPWFHQILRRLCLDHLRRRRPKVEITEIQDRLPGSDGREITGAPERAELRRVVHAALDRLAPGDREILVLREFQELSYAEIAETLGIPRGTVMSRLHYARRRLRDQLAPLLGRDTADGDGEP